MAGAILTTIRRAFVRIRYHLFLRPSQILRTALFGRRKSQYNRFLRASFERNRWHPDRPGESQTELLTRLIGEYHAMRRQLSPKQVSRAIIRLEREVARHALREDPVVRRFRQAERALVTRLSQPDAEEMREKFEKGLCTCGSSASM